MRFTWITVGLLALLGFSACGVGVDDPAVEQAVATSGKNGQALEGKPVEADPVKEPTTAAGNPVDPSISALPTDPVPLHNPTPVSDGQDLSASEGLPPMEPPPGTVLPMVRQVLEQ
ncbi:MAG: hypothetical protein IPJ65_31260 [Archangiaceae bacterium]|nr:hypothetical protein [Archangiaceae bacterium]